MLAKRSRLNLRAHPQFTKVFTLPYFVLRITENDHKDNRYGFLTSKKIDRRATVRNRTKRVLRSCIEEMLENIKTGYDMLFVLKKESVGVAKSNIASSIKTIFNKEGLIK